jgi:hypothetical protein
VVDPSATPPTLEELFCAITKAPRQRVSSFSGTGTRTPRCAATRRAAAVGLALGIPVLRERDDVALPDTPNAPVCRGLRDTAELALLGPVAGSSAGALSVWRSGFLLVIVALASALTAVRHTRVEEGRRRELLGATVVGRQAPLTAALLSPWRPTRWWRDRGRLRRWARGPGSVASGWVWPCPEPCSPVSRP